MVLFLPKSRRRLWTLLLRVLIVGALVKLIYNVRLGGPQTISSLISLARSQGSKVVESNSGQQLIDFNPVKHPLLVQVQAIPKVPPSLNVAVLEHAGFHDEVVGALVTTLQHASVTHTVYRDSWRWNFAHVLSAFATKSNAIEPYPKHHVTGAIEEGVHNLVFHVSCDTVWDHKLAKETWTAFQKHDAHIVCMLHEVVSVNDRDRLRWYDIAMQDRLTFMVLSPHVAVYLRHILDRWAEENGEMVWQRVKVETFLPIFPVDFDQLGQSSDATSPVLSLSNEVRKVPADVAILGNVSPSRRDYDRFFKQLIDSLLANGTRWGYETPTPSAKHLTPLRDGLPPFRLHLIGNVPPDFVFPDLLKGLVVVHDKLLYPDFYRVIQTISRDLIVPAFKGFEYVESKLSSAIPAGILCRIPILVSPLIAEAYSFLRQPAFRLRPNGMNEVEAISLLRAGQDPWQFALAEGSTADMPELRSMAQWSRLAPAAQWNAYHDSLYQYNKHLFRRIFNTLTHS